MFSAHLASPISPARRVLCAALVLALTAAATGADLIEGFEDLKALQVRGGRARVVSAGPAVTQGKQALSLPPGARVRIALDAKEIAERPWLRIDTFSAERASGPIRLRFLADERVARLDGYVRRGSDTLAVPLTAVQFSDGTRWSGGNGGILEIHNAGAAAMVLDNVRRVAPLASPDGAVLLDFGPENQAIWPGFTPAGLTSPHLRWAPGTRAEPTRHRFPDPLGQDALGPGASGPKGEQFVLRKQSPPVAVAALWITHHAPNESQQASYLLRHRGRTLLRRRLSPREIFSEDGLLWGCDGAWTPEWFNEVLAPHFVQRVEVELSDEAETLASFGCQVAAAVLVPAARRGELRDYLEAVDAQLATYRRQFVLARRAEPVCTVQPTDAERRAGLIAFAPPGDAAFVPRWTPAPADRAKELHVVVARGQFAAVPLALAPTADLPQVGGQLDRLRTPRGRMLAGPDTSLELQFLQRVPRVRDGVVDFVPWVLQPGLQRLVAGGVHHAAVLVKVGERVEPGTYAGAVSLRGSEGTVNVPLTVRVVDVGPPAPPAPFGWMEPYAFWSYQCMLQAVPTAQRWSVLRQVRERLLTAGFTTLSFRGPRFLDNRRTYTEWLINNLRACPPRHVRAGVLLQLTWALDDLAKANAAPPSQAFQTALELLTKEARRLTDRAGLAAPTCAVGSARSGLSRALAAAKVVRAAGGRTALRGKMSEINALPAAQRKQLPVLFDLLLIAPDEPGLAKLAAADAKTPHVCVSTYAPDRYTMGWFAAASGAAGAYVQQLVQGGEPHDGENMEGVGLVALGPRGKVQLTLGAVRARQGTDEFRLLCRARSLYAAAEARDAPAVRAARTNLGNLLAAIQNHVAKHPDVHFSTVALRTSAATHAEMDRWRAELTKALAELAAAMGSDGPP